MNDEKRSLLKRVMEFDSYQTAEDLVKDAEKDGVPIPDHQKAIDDAGFFFHIENHKVKEELLKSESDTYFSMPGVEAMKLIANLSFEKVLVKVFFSNSSEKNEAFIIYWNPNGFLLTFESYNGHVNRMVLHFEVLERKVGKLSAWELHASGGYSRTLTHNCARFAGHIDVREGLKFAIENIYRAGKLQKVWKCVPYQHFLWLVTHQEEHDQESVSWNQRSNNYDTISFNRAKQLPDHVRKAIGR